MRTCAFAQPPQPGQHGRPPGADKNPSAFQQPDIPAPAQEIIIMFLLDADSQMDCPGMLVAAGSAVNSTGDESGQSPAHLAACGGHALCLLWLLHTGADANQQDVFGETPVHKAARAGSVECIAVLVASEARLGICNHEGKTAEDLAWEGGWEECGRLLETVRVSRQVGGPKGDGESGCRVSAGLKRAGESLRGQYGKRARDW